MLHASNAQLLIRLPAHMGDVQEDGIPNNLKKKPDCGLGTSTDYLRIHTMSAASYDSAHMGEGVEYHTVYGVSPWFTRTYLLPYRVCCTVS
jgi:hypothetical protein